MWFEDDGRGMDEETAARARDPFYTSKGFKKVGLGLPLLEATASSCHGDFDLESEPGRGTTVQARLEQGHWDCPPLGDLSDTVLSLLVSLDDVDLRFSYSGDRGEILRSPARRSGKKPGACTCPTPRCTPSCRTTSPRACDLFSAEP
ncbi:MAG: ATP-binding protein [Comamonadaceae bacterium]|nr:ATP-binding protein [Comamonadaceae bacterium]